MIMRLCGCSKKDPTFLMVGFYFHYICIMHLVTKILRGFENPCRGNRMANLFFSVLFLLSFFSIRGSGHFTNAPSLAITATHLIYSTTYHDWRLAGELEVGERVLTFKGEATVSSTEKRAGIETVYNLEVKDLHNFLVGDEGVVVHNTCPLQLIRDLIKDSAIRIKKINGQLEIPHNWVRNDVLRDGKVVGSRYSHPTNNKIQIRIHDKGDLSHKPHNYNKPYARYQLDGVDDSGNQKYADIYGNYIPISDPNHYEKTHFILEKLDVD